MRIAFGSALVVACACATTASASSASAPVAAAPPVAAAAARSATATLEPRSGSTLTGTARLSAASEGLAVHVDVQGANPGPHGIHIHEKGDCSDPKAASAGGHYNPNSGAHHGGPRTPVRHGGDLGNLEVDSSGKGSLEVVVPDLSVDGAQNGVVGKAIVVHE